MYPFDPGPALRCVPRAGRADDQHRRAVAPRVEDRHRRVHEADVRVQRRGHHAIGRLAVALRDRHRVLVVQAQDHLRRAVAEVVDEAVVQPAVARAGIERDVRDVERAQHRRRSRRCRRRVVGGAATGASWMMVCRVVHAVPRRTLAAFGRRDALDRCHFAHVTSVRGSARRLDHLRPFRDTRPRGASRTLHACCRPRGCRLSAMRCFMSGVCMIFIDLRVEQVHDVARRAGRGEHAVPLARFVAFQARTRRPSAARAARAGARGSSRRCRARGRGDQRHRGRAPA